MIRELQCVNWSLLDPSPVKVEGPVIAVLGQNGSCKSSFMDAIKALLGARRFGQGRTATTYRYTGRAGQPGAKRAYVFGLFENDKRLPIKIKASEFTVILEASSSQRRFLVLEGDHLLRGEDIGSELESLRNSHPRSKWLRPAEYVDRMLEPIGVGPAMRRFLELPQGEIGRVMDRDNDKLVALLLELCGSRQAAERFAAAEEALGEARDAQGNVERRVERLNTHIAQTKLRAIEAQKEGEQRQRLADLLFQIEQLPDPEPPAPRPRKKRAPDKPRAPRSRLLPAATRRALGLVVKDGVWRVPTGEEERVAAELGPGEAIPRSDADLSELVYGQTVVEGEDSEPLEDDDVDERHREDPGPDPQEQRRLGELKQIGEQLRNAAIAAKGGGEALGFQDSGELLGAARALLAQGIPDAFDQDQASVSEDLANLEQRLRVEESELEQRENVLREASAQLTRAQEIYTEAAKRALDGAARRFAELSNHAGMRGQMEVAATAKGVECRISASEDPGGELRPLHGARNSLSGGWRASVIVLAVLACLSSEGSTPLLLIDEVGSSLDEERLRKLGEAFDTLGQQEGLTTMITVPSKTISQTVANFASQQIAFFRPEVDEPLAPPPHMISKSRTLRAAA